MTYRVTIQRSAEKGLTRIARRSRERVLVAIEALADDPRPQGAKRLVGQRLWRIRVGDYRVVYDVRDDELVVVVVRVGHRSTVYRRT